MVCVLFKTCAVCDVRACLSAAVGPWVHLTSISRLRRACSSRFTRVSARQMVF